MNFVNLYLETEYTMLGSTIKLEELVKRCVSDGIKSIAICDNSNMHGAFKFYNLCVTNNIKPIIGLNISVESEMGFYNNVLVYAKGEVGYKNLLSLASQAKLKKVVSQSFLRSKSRDLIAVLPSIESEVVKIYNEGNIQKAKEVLNSYKKIFEDIYLGIDLQTDNSKRIVRDLISLGASQGVESVAINKTSYFKKEHFEVYQVLRCVDLGITEYPYDERELYQYFLSEEEANFLFKDYPRLLENTQVISDKCNLVLKYDTHYFPSYPNALGKSFEYLTQLCKLGLNKRLEGLDVDNKVYIDRLFYELDVINKMGFCDYFLIVYDFVRYAKKNDILVGPGRGSAPGSLVAYCLGITDIDPIKYDLLFERFLNPERITMPDIDIDFPDNRRDEVISYVANKYGKEKVANITTFGTYGPRLAIRDVVRASKLSEVVLNEILRHVKNNDKSINDCLEKEEVFRKLAESNPDVNKVVRIVKVMEGLPRHTSTHAAGIIIASDDLINYTALQTGLNDILQTQYEASDLEQIGLVKMDFLGIRNLTIIDDVIKKIRETDPNFNINNIPMDDVYTYRMIASGDTDGIFQLESPGMRNVLVQLRTSNFLDIVNANALYRPGPMEMIPSFINRKFGREKVDYIDDSIREILEPTYGTIVFQEQIMLIVRKFAGYTLGMSDILRRAVSKKNASVLENERTRFVENSIKKGHSSDMANKVYDYIVKFANYGFNKSHSVAYAMIAYQMAYLKRHYYRYFITTLMSNSIGSVNLIRNYINDCKKKNVVINLPSVNYSRDKFSVHNNEIYFSLLGVAQLGALTLNNFLEERDKNGLYKSYQEFVNRTKDIMNKRIVENLIHAGALDEFGMPRKQMVLEYDNCLNIAKYNELLGDSLLDKEFSDEEYSFEEISKYEREALGFNFKYSIFLKYRDIKEKYNTIDLINLKVARNQKALFIIRSIREIKTKRDDYMAFLSVYDESDEIDVVCFSNEYERFKNVLKIGAVYVAAGDVEIRNDKKQFVLKTINILK
ncbi:MAG: DNA polymerase III subunit alpha [Bacilli bacterium]|nr:DNA polymerase III subunit alpha [Bacilli bacterium]